MVFDCHFRAEAIFVPGGLGIAPSLPAIGVDTYTRMG